MYAEEDENKLLAHEPWHATLSQVELLSLKSTDLSKSLKEIHRLEP